MNDLISRAAAIEKFAEKREVWYGNDPLPSNESLMWQAAIGITEELPTIDAIPVVPGRWKDNGNGTVSCSRCATWFPKEREPYMRFCGYCGAKM